MVKVYGIPNYPDCAGVAEKIEASGRESGFEIIDVGEHVAHLKAFLQLRDREEAFRSVREGGYVGIPCLIREDGAVSFDPAELGL